MKPPQPQPHQPPSAATTWVIDRVNLFFRFRRLYKMLVRRWVLIALCSAAGVASATYLALHSPNIYSAASKLGIAPRIQTAFHSQAQYLEELNSFYDSQLQYLTSSKIMARVQEKVRQTGPVPPNPQLATRAVKQAGSFALVVEATDLDFARRYASCWATEFIAFKRELREQAIGKTAANTREEILNYEKNLEKARTALLEFQRSHNLGSIKETGDAAQQRLDKLEAEYQDIKTLRQRLETKTPEEIANGLPTDSYHLSTETTEPKSAPAHSAETINPLARFDSASKYGELKLELRNRESQLTHLGATLKPKHPYMVRLAQEIQRSREQLQFQLELIAEKQRAQVKSLKEDEESYLPLITELRQQVLSSRSVQYQFERLQEEESNIKQVLANLRKAEESLNASNIDESLFHIIEEGTGSLTPVRPNRPKMILAGLVIGLGLGLALVYLLDRLDDRLELAEEIEAALDQPVLGQIPQLIRKRGQDEHLVVGRMDDHHAFAESLRGLRSALVLNQDPRPKQALLLTSAVPGDGKTTVTVNLAFTLALLGQRVLLIDADLRRGDTHLFFANPREPGLSEVLTGQLHWRDVLRPAPLPNLQVIHSGKLPRNPGELLSSSLFGELLRQTREQYDHILVDCPPLTAIDDTFSMINSTDGLLFVVRSGRTSMRFATNALDILRQRSAPVLGVVLNGITADNPYYYYRNYYHAYYTQHPDETTHPAVQPLPATKMAAPKPIHQTPDPAPAPEPSGTGFSKPHPDDQWQNA